jgi:hypothetical protein
MALGVDSTPSGNKYQEHFLGVKAGGAWGWQPHHLNVPNVMEIWEPKPPGTLWATPGLLRDSIFTVTVCFICIKQFSQQDTQTRDRIIHSFFHSVICLTTGPTPLPKRFLHIVRSRAFSFKWEYPLRFLRSSSSSLRLLLRLLVTSISPLIFSSINCFRNQFRDQSSKLSVSLFHVGYSSAHWL